MTEGDTFGDDRVHIGRVAFVLSVLQILVQCAKIFASHALYNQYNDILLFSERPFPGSCCGMDGGINLCHLLLAAEILGHHECCRANGAIDGERCVEHQCSIDRTVHILVGIRDGDGTYSLAESTTDACHDKRSDSR